MQSHSNEKSFNQKDRVDGDHSRWHMLHYAVKQVEALMVVGLGGNELLEHSKQTRLEQQKEIGLIHRTTALELGWLWLM